MKRIKLLFTFLASCLFVSNIPGAENAGFSHRSIAFHESKIDYELVKIAADLGFNTVELQTEGGTLEPLERLRKRIDEEHMFDRLKELGMRSSLWVHELEDYDESWGPIKLENEKLWQEIAKKYNYILNELYPEIDDVVLTVVESETRITEGALLNKLIKTIHAEVVKSEKQMIMRTFVWHPSEREGVMQAILDIPDDIVIHTKYVPQDWHLRSIDNAMLGKMGNHKQIVEIDLAGEYFKKRYVGNVFVEDLKSRYAFWKNNDIDGIVIRVNRIDPISWNTIRGEVMEINLWVLGYWMQGKSEEEAWSDYTLSRFGEKADPSKMMQMLRPTGMVIAEALCVDAETFSDSRYPLKNIGNPFDLNWSVYRWDSSFVDGYEAIVRADPAVIQRKELGYQSSLISAEKSLSLLETMKGNLPESGYRFLKWKLEENKFLLQWGCEMHLAWLKSTRSIYVFSKEEKMALNAQIVAHLETLQKLQTLANTQSIQINWLDREHSLRRGQYISEEDLQTLTRYCEKSL